MSSDEQRRALAERLRFARAYAAERLPWFAPALFRCRIVLSEEVTVAAIDRSYQIYWNPAVVETIYRDRPVATALAELAFLWVHEISHRLRRHAERAEEVGVHGEPDARRWNAACDLEINDAVWPGLAMPAAYPGRHPDRYGLPVGQLAEVYYRRLPAPPTDQPDEGSGVHGRPRRWERPDDRPPGPLEEVLLRREVARRVAAATTGGIPGGWRSWAADVLGSRTDWRRRLGHRMSVALQRGVGSRTDYSFARPNRRQSVYHPILPPSLSGGHGARIAIVVDTSGSMDPPRLQRALAEVAAVVRQFQHPVTIIPCDTYAYEPVRVVAAAEAYRIDYLPGGSGTDMRVGIAAAVRLRPAPDTILVLTDGETPYPDRPVRIPVVFGIFTTAGERVNLPPTPPWSPDASLLIQT